VRRLSDLPIKHKLTLISLLTTIVALLLACTGFVAYERITFKKDLVDDVSSVAEIIGYNSASALSFNDAASAEQTLRALSAKPHIIAGCIYDHEGHIFATYPKGREASDFGPPARTASERFSRDGLDLYRPIVVSSESVGTIYLRADLGGMRERLERYALILGAVILLAILVAYLLVSRLQRVISSPFDDLVAVASRVAVEKDYAIRAVKRSEDELGRLIDSFNDMLSQIQARDVALQKTRDELETRVAIRTRELAQERARFKFIFDSVPVGFSWMLRDQLATRMANPAYTLISGVPEERCREVEPYRNATHPDDRERQESLQRRVNAGEIDHYEIEKRFVHADGSVRWAVLTVHLHRDSAGEDAQVNTLVDITERKQVESRLEETHKRLVATSRQAGMAEVATGVLHNVGNVLNSVNVSTTLVSDQVRHSKSVNVAKLAALFDQHKSDIAAFLTKDARGLMIPGYLATLAESLAAERHTLITELEHLRKNVEHIKDIVAMQQAYARTSGVIETVSVPDMVEDALRVNSGSLSRHDVDTFRDYQVRPVVTTDKHKVMQILVNLVRNAKYACDDSGRSGKQITVRITSDDQHVRIAVIDNGIGIPAENLTRIFNHGFTTRAQGHGFGLHSGALAAKELGGSISAQSAGAGQGATFTLELPFKLDTSIYENSTN